jgi:hypothetical protein
MGTLRKSFVAAGLAVALTSTGVSQQEASDSTPPGSSGGPAASGAFLPVSAPDGFGYSVRSDVDDNLYLINLSTGATTLIGPVGFGDVEALTAGPDAFLYGVDDVTNQLIRIDPATGAGTAIGPLGVAITDMGLTFDAAGNLWMSVDAPQNFYSVNPASGAATLIGPQGQQVTALTASGNTIYGLGGDNTNNLVTINTTTGAATVVGLLGGGISLSDGGLDFAADGTLYGIHDTGRLFTVNPATGAATAGAVTLAGFESLATQPVQALTGAGRVRFGENALTVDENTGFVNVTVLRTEGSLETRVDVLGVGGTATPGLDFGADPVRATIQTGGSMAIVQIPIVNDALVEGNETVVLTLINLGPGLSKGSPDTIVLTIVDDDQPAPPETASLTVQVIGSGDGIVLSDPAGITHNTGTTVRLFGVPDANSVFGGWRGDPDCFDGVVTLAANTNCRATFAHLSENAAVDFNGDLLGDIFPYSIGQVVGRGAEFNGDAFNDGFLYNVVTGELRRATSSAGGVVFADSNVGDGLMPLAVDLNADALTDILFYNPVTGATTGCLAPGFACAAGSVLPTNNEIHPVAFNTDGRTDLFVYDRSSGAGQFFGNSGDPAQFTAGPAIAPAAGRSVAAGDFNGDVRTDLVLYDPLTGAATRVENTSGGLASQAFAGPPGLILRVGAIDTDATSDLFAYTPATGATLQVTTGGGFSVVGGGALPGNRKTYLSDLNGDNRADFLLFDPLTGQLLTAVVQPGGGFTTSNSNLLPDQAIVSQRRR